MMHQAAPSSTVVVLEDANTGAPFRELDHHRNGFNSHVRVVMPFDTEYKFRFKFPSDMARRRLEISIDGTVVVRDLIITHDSVLERFLDSAKRFKFVKATSEGVADPTSPNNGLIMVKLWREKPLPLQGLMLGMLRGMTSETRYKASGSCVGESLCSDHVFMSHMSASVGQEKSIGGVQLNASYEAGATVEGRDSSQRFGTTQWEGDAELMPQVFQFQLVGHAAAATSGLYCAQCGTMYVGGKIDRYCSACGARR